RLLQALFAEVWSVAHLEEQAPIDCEVARKLAKTQQALVLFRQLVLLVGKENLVPLLERRIQTIDRSHHRMAESINGSREFNGHERGFLPVKEVNNRFVFVNAGLVLKMRKNSMDHLLSDNRWQKIVKHNPLIVPPHRILELFEATTSRHEVNHAVVKT